MMNTKIFTLFIVLSIKAVLCPSVHAQHIDTILVKQLIGNGNFQSTSPTSIYKKDDLDLGKYFGMPQDIDTSQLSFIPFDIGQYYFDRLRNGKITYDEFVSRFRIKVDTNNFSKRLIKHRVGVFCGLSGKNKIVIVDSNNNYNFSDDTQYVFDTTYFFKKKWEEIIDTAPIVKVNFEVFNFKKINKKERDLKITVFNQRYNYKDDMAKKLEVYYTTYNYFMSTYNFNGEDYDFEVESRTPNNILVTPADKSKNKNIEKENYTFKLHEKFVVNGNVISISRVSPLIDTLFITNHGKGQYVEGNKLGMLHPSFCQKNLTNDTFCLDSFRGKYILIDFWGTWCKPCIASIPDLKQIRDKFSPKKLQILSIAADNDIHKLNQEIERFGMNWLHTIQPLNSRDLKDATNIFAVNAFPTTILIDRQGLIIDRGSGSDFVKDLYKKLEKIIE